MLDSSKLKEFADHKFEFDENGRKFSKRVENTVAEEEIARYEEFLLLPVFFKRLVLQTSEHNGLIGKGLNDWNMFVGPSAIKSGNKRIHTILSPLLIV